MSDTPKAKPKQYSIKTIADFDKIPFEKVPDCLQDFATYLHVRRLMQTINLNRMTMPDHFQWIDDGKHDFIMRVIPEDPKV